MTTGEPKTPPTWADHLITKARALLASATRGPFEAQVIDEGTESERYEVCARMGRDYGGSYRPVICEANYQPDDALIAAAAALITDLSDSLEQLIGQHSYLTTNSRQLKKERAERRAEIELLHVALRKYGRHDQKCSLMTMYVASLYDPVPMPSCDCGLHAALELTNE